MDRTAWCEWIHNPGLTTTIWADGTKVRKPREWIRDKETWTPESIDLKITDQCMAGCAWCHESSTPRGIHGDMDFIQDIVLSCRGEVAVGGGDPLSHREFWKWAETRCVRSDNSSGGAILNVTINERNIADGLDRRRRIGMLLDLHEMGVIHGIGLSPDPDRSRIEDSKLSVFNHVPDAVVHLIAGVHSPEEAYRYPKVLILGYKDYGFGHKFLKAGVLKNIEGWRRHLMSVVNRSGGKVTSFDNLAIEQMRLREVMPVEAWNGFYMGGEGEFTMYVDAVKQEYAASSTSPRYPCGSKTLDEMFADVRRRAGHAA